MARAQFYGGDSAAIGLYLHRDGCAAEIRFYLHRDGCAAEIRVLSTQRLVRGGEVICIYTENVVLRRHEFDENKKKRDGKQVQNMFAC